MLYRVLIMGMIIGIVLAGCGGKDISEADAERGIKALFAGDYERAQDFLCQEDIDKKRPSADAETTQLMDVEVDCERINDEMVCDLIFKDPETGDSIELEARYQISDGRLCEWAED